MTVWREDPALKGRFHPEFADDIQIIVHEGSFRFTTAKPEVMWGRVYSQLEYVRDDKSSIKVYKATLLNEPHHLKSLKAGETILFMAHEGYQHPVYVTEEYIRDRIEYEIIPCQGCGLPEVFDPISKLMQHSFPDLESETGTNGLEMFSSFCPLCGKVLVIRHWKLKASESSTENSSLWNRAKKWFKSS